MEIRGANLLMMGRWVMFSEIISFVQNASSPINVELALADAVANPIKAHVECFGSFLFDRVVGDSRGGTVVGLNGSGRLGMTKFFETHADRACFFAVVEEGSKLSFGGTGNDFAQDLAEDVDGTVGGWWGAVRRRGFGGVMGTTAEEVVSGGARASLGCSKVGGIALDVEDHVAGVEADRSVGMRSAVIEELGQGFQSGFGAVCLLGG